MATSGPARPDVGRRLALVVVAVGMALCGLLLGVPVAANGTTAPPGAGARPAPGPGHQLAPVARDAEVDAAAVSPALQLLPGAAAGALPARPAAVGPRGVFAAAATPADERVRGVDVDVARGRAPPARPAVAVH